MESVPGPASKFELVNGEELELPSDAAYIELVTEAFDERLKVFGWRTEEISKLNLGLREALANAIKHGNRFHPSKKVKLIVEISKDKIYIKISDAGEGFDPEGVPDPTVDENLLQGSGRGIDWMKRFFDTCQYSNGGRTVELIKEKGNENSGEVETKK